MKDSNIRKVSSSGRFFFAIGLILIFIIGMKSSLQPSQRSHTYLALGDSYTIGEQVTANESFPNQVVDMLRKNKLRFKNPKIVAKTGWTTDELLAGIKKAKLRRHYDFVTLLIGVNNQYRERKVVDFIPEFELLLKQAIEFAGNDTSHVIVLSIPDWGVTPFAKDKDSKKIAQEIDEYNSAIIIITQKYKVHYLDITPGTREAASDSSLLTNDGLHPSGKEYERWAKKIAAVIQNNL